MVDFAPMSSPQETVLVVLKDSLIAEDLAQSIAEALPGARVVVAETLTRAETAVQDIGRVVLAFLADTPETILSSGLARMLGEQRSRVVLTGDWDSDQARKHGWEALPFPFASETVHAIVTRCPPPLPEGRPEGGQRAE